MRGDRRGFGGEKTRRATLTEFGMAPFEIIDGDRGKSYPKQWDFSDSGHCVFLNATNVTRNGFEFSECQFISEQKDNQLRKGKLQRDDIVLTTRGTIGNVAHFKVSVPFEQMRINSGMVILRCDPNKILPTYLYHFLRSPSFHGQVNSLRSGVAQPQLPIRDMKRIKIPLPNLTEQRRIASILSTYDELIENNRRRIRLLEQAARLLYKEWFVHLRFPGHERITVTNGMPEGWKRKSLGEVLVYLESGGRPKGGAKEEGIPSIGAENVIGIGQYDYAKEKYVSEEYFGTMRKGVVRNRDVVVYKDGANIGRSSYFGDGFPHKQCAVNEHVFILRAVPEVGQTLLYFWVAQDETRQHIANLNANTAQPGVSQGKMKTLTFSQPRQAIARLFNETVEPVVRQIFLLARENRMLSQARDLLLPRLMKGDTMSTIA